MAFCYFLNLLFAAAKPHKAGGEEQKVAGKCSRGNGWESEIVGNYKLPVIAFHAVLVIDIMEPLGD